MNKPNELRVDHHSYNDGWNSHTIIVALFDDVQSDVPVGWIKQNNTYYYSSTMKPAVAYSKRFPYGTRVITTSDSQYIA